MLRPPEMPLILSNWSNGYDTVQTQQGIMNGDALKAPQLPPLETSMNGSILQEPFSKSPPSTSASPSTPITSRSFSSNAISGQLQLKAEDSAARQPVESHRRVSSGRFTHPQLTPIIASPNLPSSPTVAPRLQHRHTLEVPRVTPRLSKELYSAAPSETGSTANGRVSPVTAHRRRGSLNLGRRATRSINSDGYVEEVPLDEDALRWSEAIRQKRENKKRRKEVEEEEDRVVVGTKVDQNHVNYVTAYNMLTGIRFTVSRTNAKIDRELTDADFVMQHKFSFDITGNELTPSAKYDFKFKDYAPWVFRHLRSIFRLDPADYLVSLTSKYILSELGSPGKSGSFFYFSRDYKYIIKTIHHSEHVFLRKILKDYYNHVRQNPNTLLSQFYGLHRVKLPYGRKIHFVIMNNLFPPHRDIHQTFDLKGSTIGRDYKEEDLEKSPRATLKDLNWVRRQMHLEFGPTKKKAFVEQMDRDVNLLKRLKIMDYSLLVGIHDIGKGNEEDLRHKTLKIFQPGGEDVEEPEPSQALTRSPSKLESARKAKELRQIIKNQKPIPLNRTNTKMPNELSEEMHGKRSNFYFYSDDGGFRATHENDQPGEEIYYLGIIDCLTKYGFIKKTEHFFKGLTNPEGEISAIPPDRYGSRFVKFITGITAPKEKQEEKKPSRELDVNDRTRTTVDDAGTEGTTLPVVEEAAENASTGGRSGRSEAKEKEEKST